MQRHKLLHFFHVMDHDGNGVLEEEDFTLVAESLANHMGLTASSRARLELKVKAYGLFLHVLSDMKATEARITEARWLDFGEAFILDVSNGYIQQSCTYLFSLFDQDRDGFIDEREYLAMFHAYDLYTANAKMAFDRLDRNSDGRISGEELVQAFTEFFMSSDPDAPGNWIFGDWRKDEF